MNDLVYQLIRFIS